MVTYLLDIMEYADSDQVIEVLGGAVSTRVIRHPNRSFAFEVTLDLEKGSEHFSTKPPLHFHANQDEFIQATEGKIGLELEGTEYILLPGQDEYCIESWANHRSYPLELERQEGRTVVKFLLSGAKSPEVYELNTLFFENWYKYQEHVVRKGGKIDLIQALSTFDAGGTYVSFPRWVPFGRQVSQLIGIVVGRWLGGLLGYQPFYREWSTDWQLACDKMESSIFQRRWAVRSKPD
ncbi:uncharacterized protein GGS22DRAFT_128161 [Annulohypoxylon maeteangense]|uniref:uncharacterized protein n=1 Tax=Annulohypoxylon maeteangense TaxID=1927788 RepID=UPI0020084365|nr:uncharacterized protein GGS22DRAFT_128161 [Annulohypoxylon maeteangense]KAI0886386.1 hypothetical protein GGS22DRAFT_128161 [Annulohypoxylon maeteangense]